MRVPGLTGLRKTDQIPLPPSRVIDKHVKCTEINVRVEFGKFAQLEESRVNPARFRGPGL